MRYSIRHMTRFDYSDDIRESVMEVRKQPRTEMNQRCYSFNLTIEPRARVFEHTDYLGNIIHHFDIPSAHHHLIIRADALVELDELPPRPAALPASAWDELDAATVEQDFWDMLTSSRFVQETPLVEQLAAELRVHQRRDDPLSLLCELNTALYDTFDYAPATTQVDSPIDHALAERRGVCQDFAHIMLALVRRLGIPCRYISGYLYTGKDEYNRSAEDASHAWIEAWLPDLGWIGFDPTNNRIADHHHIRVGVGRDYADVPPTHGVFKGEAESELSVGVQVKITDQRPFDEARFAQLQQPAYDIVIQQQQQQQQ